MFDYLQKYSFKKSAKINMTKYSKIRYKIFQLFLMRSYKIFDSDLVFSKSESDLFLYTRNV